MLHYLPSKPYFSGCVFCGMCLQLLFFDNHTCGYVTCSYWYVMNVKYVIFVLKYQWLEAPLYHNFLLVFSWGLKRRCTVKCSECIIKIKVLGPKNMFQLQVVFSAILNSSSYTYKHLLTHGKTYKHMWKQWKSVKVNWQLTFEVFWFRLNNLHW